MLRLLSPPDLSEQMLISSHIGQIFLFTAFHASFLVSWQNGAGRGVKLQQGTYIIQGLGEELMELHDSILIISPLGSNYVLGTFRLSTNLSSSNSHGL